MAARPAAGRFVGREGELAVIADVCALARAGRGRLVLVRGEAGIGKSALCEEAAQRAGTDGFTVVWGRCWADGGSPPLWPWPSILSDLGGREAGGLLGDAERGGLDPERFDRFRAVGDLLNRWTQQTPLMIVLDDIHVAATAAVLLARFLARELERRPFVMLMTRRSPVTPSRTDSGRLLDELERESIVLPLSTFDEHDTAVYLSAHGIRTADEGLLPALFRLTAGNPMLLARAVAHAPQSDLLGGVERAVDGALGALLPAHRKIAALAALLGTETAATEVAALARVDPPEVHRAIEAACSAGLIDPAPGCWIFTHELVRRAAVGVLTPLEALDAHARAARLATGDRRPAAVTRRADHALAAAARSEADLVVAVDVCREAAHVLASGFDYERAAELLDSAMELAARRSPPAMHVDLILEWANALLVSGRLADARAAYERAVAATEAAGDPVARARAALGLGGVWVNEHRGQAERRRVLLLQRLALESLPHDDVVLRARLGARLAAEAVYDGEPVEPVFRAVAAARRSGDQTALAEALSLSHHALLAPEHLDERLRIADELITVASAVGDSLRVLFGLLWKAVDQFHAGDVHAIRTLNELRRRADAVGCRSISYVVGAIDVMRLIRDGRLAEAETAAQDCFAQGIEVGDADATGYYGVHLLTIRWLQDRDAELLSLARDIATSDTLVNPEFAFRAGAAAVAARAGLSDEAAAGLRDLRAGGLGALPRSSTWLAGMVIIMEAAWALGDVELAREVYPLLEPFADRPAMPSLAVSCFGAVERALGLAACTWGDGDLAVDHLERAVERNTALGHRPLTALARADLASALERRGRPGDRDTAVVALRVAACAADGMGMEARAASWRDRADALAAAEDSATLRRDGSRWIVDVDDRSVVVPDLVGVSYLGSLLSRPGDEIEAVELCGGTAVDACRHELVDRETLDAYRRRVREIDRQLDAARSSGRASRVERLESEREQLRRELSKVLGVTGRARRFADSGERARTAVRKAIARAIDVIAESDDRLGAELRATVSTGRKCAYRPDPSNPRRWSVVLDAP